MIRLIRIMTHFCILFFIHSSELLPSTNNNLMTYEQADTLYSIIKNKGDVDTELAHLNLFTSKKRFHTDSCDQNNNNNNDLQEPDSPFLKLLNKYKDIQGNSILHHACNAGHQELTEELLKFTDTLELQNNNKETPLFLIKKYSIGNLLLNNSANTIHQNINKQIPLILHIIHDNIPVTHQLLQHMQQYAPNNILQLTKQSPFQYIKSLDMAKLLSKFNMCRITIPMPQIIFIPNTSLFKLAFLTSINTQPNINICNQFDETLLHYAAKENNYDIACLLLQKNINLHTQNKTGQTAVHIAAYHNYTEFIALLLSHAIHLESIGKLYAKSHLLETKDIDGSTALMIAVIENKINTAHCLIDNGADIHTRNKYGHTLLHFIKDAILAQKLIDYGLEVNSNGIFNHTPLHFVSNEKVAQVFIANKAYPNMTSVDKQTPLHLAKTAAIAQILINAKALINRQNTQGKTPLHCAVLRNNIPLCKLLLYQNADTSIRDFKGNTAAESIDCKASNDFFVLEDLEVLLKGRKRIPDEYAKDLALMLKISEK